MRPFVERQMAPMSIATTSGTGSGLGRVPHDESERDKGNWS